MKALATFYPYRVNAFSVQGRYKIQKKKHLILWKKVGGGGVIFVTGTLWQHTLSSAKVFVYELLSNNNVRILYRNNNPTPLSSDSYLRQNLTIIKCTSLV